METIYLICLLVGGFFVLLSMFGGGDTDVDADVGGDIGADLDVDIDADSPLHGGSATAGAGPGLVDVFSVRALFLFAAFFGLTGTALSLLDSGEPLTTILALLVGLATGLGGNYVIQRVGYDHISSDVTSTDLKGQTGRVLVPFDGERKGKISIVARGHRLQLVARAFENQTIDAFQPGDEVVIVRVDGAIAEVVKPE
jgi:membrane protein implicated in regulation of membrane protease activity